MNVYSIPICSNCELFQAVIQCNDCLENNVKNSSNDDNVFCKVCSEIHIKIKKYCNHSDSYQLITIKSKICCNFESIEGEYRCKDCAEGEQIYCLDCYRLHGQIKSTRNHNVVLLTESIPRTVATNDSRCTKTLTMRTVEMNKLIQQKQQQQQHSRVKPSSSRPDHSPTTTSIPIDTVDTSASTFQKWVHIKEQTLSLYNDNFSSTFLSELTELLCYFDFPISKDNIFTNTSGTMAVIAGVIMLLLLLYSFNDYSASIGFVVFVIAVLRFLQYKIVKGKNNKTTGFKSNTKSNANGNNYNSTNTNRNNRFDRMLKINISAATYQNNKSTARSTHLEISDEDDDEEIDVSSYIHNSSINRNSNSRNNGNHNNSYKNNNYNNDNINSDNNHNSDNNNDNNITNDSDDAAADFKDEFWYKRHSKAEAAKFHLRSGRVYFGKNSSKKRKEKLSE